MVWITITHQNGTVRQAYNRSIYLSADQNMARNIQELTSINW